MKIYVFALLIVTAVVVAVPTEDKNTMPRELLLQKEDESLKLQVTQETPVKEHHRARRFTCDLLSGAGVDHSACAAHCILRGKTGGRCNNDRVCVCRERSWIG
ncbi:defensin-like [Nylanderia fulva]|uniref:defensin-like n=1 Tax=Nylanderia fulva TaxID=613905 RepID=UPI0010FB756B|nr:defensin-like [Nylanderia fulva]